MNDVVQAEQSSGDVTMADVSTCHLSVTWSSTVMTSLMNSTAVCCLRHTHCFHTDCDVTCVTTPSLLYPAPHGVGIMH